MDNTTDSYFGDIFNSSDGVRDEVCFQDGVVSRGILNIPALVSMVVFYVLIVVIGILSSWRKDKRQTPEDYIVAGRDLGLFVGIVTLSATWVGGGYLNGTAEKIFTPGYGNGAVWTQAPVCASLGVIVGGLMFAHPMREAGYVTMLDPFQARYGDVTTAILFVVASLGNIFYSAAVLSALGATLSVVVGLQHSIAVIVSVSVTVCYTMFGGLRSVAYTDMLQLACMVIGMWLAVPFAMMNPAVAPLSLTAHASNSWLGDVKGGIWSLYYVDMALAMIFGGIPWQDFFQRVLSQRTSRRAVICSVVGGSLCIIIAIPAYLIGGIAASTDWNATDYRLYATMPVPACDRKLALPLVLQFLTPLPVAVIGLGAISAAVMSSADSSVLSPGSLFSYNVYRPLRAAIGKRTGTGPASNKEMVWVTRVVILLVATAAALVAIFSNTIYGLWYLAHDFGYFTLFPQLFCLIYYRGCNIYGAICGLVLSLFLRFSAGDSLIGIPPLIKYPYYDVTTGNQLFPYRTMSAVIATLTIIGVSMLANWIRRRKSKYVWAPNHSISDGSSVEMK